MIVKGFFSANRVWRNGKTIFAAGIFIAIMQPVARAGLGDLPVGARALAMGGAYVALANTADAVFLNPGGLAQLHAVQASLFYQKPFGLDDVDFGTVSVTFPILGYRVGIGLLNIGNSLYKEQWFTLAFAHDFRKKIFYGLAFNHQRLDIATYGSDGAVGIDAGLVIPVTNNLAWGFLVKNLNHPKIGERTEELPQVFKTGLSITPTSKVLLNLEFFKETRFSEEFRFGLELQPLAQLALRAGTASNPSRFSAGFGIKLKRFSVDYAFFTHNDLGLTHQVSLSAAFGASEPSKPEPATIAARPVTAVSAPIPAQNSNNPKININTATKAELISLPGIGEKTARAIIEYREANGPFLKTEDVQEVAGIGRKKYERLRDMIVVENVAEKQ